MIPRLLRPTLEFLFFKSFPIGVGIFIKVLDYMGITWANCKCQKPRGFQELYVRFLPMRIESLKIMMVCTPHHNATGSGQSGIIMSATYIGTEVHDHVLKQYDQPHLIRGSTISRWTGGETERRDDLFFSYFLIIHFPPRHHHHHYQRHNRFGISVFLFSTFLSSIYSHIHTFVH